MTGGICYEELEISYRNITYEEKPVQIIISNSMA